MKRETERDRNPVTGDKLQTKPASDKYRENYDKIFKKDKPQQQQPK